HKPWASQWRGELPAGDLRAGGGYLLDGAVPERDGCQVEPADGDGADRGVDTPPPVLSPVHVLQVDEQGQLVDDKRDAAAVGGDGQRVAAVTFQAAQGYRTDQCQQDDT